MGHWTLNDIAWDNFDAGKTEPDLIALVKAASLVEHNGDDYARYLCEVFKGDEEFQQAAKYWAVEEVQHGQALRKWSELADSTFDFERCFKTFTTGYKLPVGVTTSVRGSRSGELVARCIVEIGTSSLYTAIKEFTDEPVLKSIASHIAADELRHYKLFYTHLQRYLEKENPSFLKRLVVALSRIAESEDDELAYAYFSVQDDPEPYDRKRYMKRCLANSFRLYRRDHIDRMTAMVFKAIGLKPNTLLNRAINPLAWGLMRFKAS